MMNRDPEGEPLLKQAIAINPRLGDLYYALGLLLVRQERTGEALAALKKATEVEPAQVMYTYTYALALNSNKQANKAVQVLEAALRTHPHHRDLLVALTTINRDRGALAKARLYARRLTELAPQEGSYQQLLQSLQ